MLLACLILPLSPKTNLTAEFCSFCNLLPQVVDLETVGYQT